MSRHESVSCDSCLKNNFRGKRYKCVICYDYDLCAACYEAGATSSRHTADHPMQCILTRADFDIYYGGEAITAEQPQAFTCPYCGKMGYTELSLQEHVTTEHQDASQEVVCPICAALPGGDPNHVTDEFGAHLTLEHRAPRDFDEPMSGVRHVRRIPHPSRGGGTAGSAGTGGSTRTRTRQSNMQFHSNATAAALSGLPVGGRDSMDPIAELLSQLSSVRSRAAAQSVSSQLQQLEMQLQSTRQQLERLPRRTGAGGGLQDGVGRVGGQVGGQSAAAAAAQQVHAAQAAAVMDLVNNVTARSALRGANAADSPYLLARMTEAESGDWERQAEAAADRSMFVQELLLSSLTEGLRLEDSDTEDMDNPYGSVPPFSSSCPSPATAAAHPVTATSPAAVAGTVTAAATPPVIVENVENIENNTRNVNNSSASSPVTTTTSPANTTTTTSSNNSNSQKPQRPAGNRVREPPPPPSSRAPLSSSPSSKMVKQ